MKILIAALAVCFALVSNAVAQCPSLFPPLPARRVVVTHRYVGVAPMVTMQVAPVVSVPVVEAPAPEVIAPAPAVTYRTYTARAYMAAPMVSSVDVVGASSAAAQRRHSNKAAHHAAKAVYHTQRAAYWATRS